MPLVRAWPEYSGAKPRTRGVAPTFMILLAAGRGPASHPAAEPQRGGSNFMNASFIFSRRQSAFGPKCPDRLSFLTSFTSASQFTTSFHNYRNHRSVHKLISTTKHAIRVLLIDGKFSHGFTRKGRIKSASICVNQRLKCKRVGPRLKDAARSPRLFQMPVVNRFHAFARRHHIRRV